MEHRYDTLSGGANGRAARYAIRKHLGYGKKEWEQLPWDERRTFLEELIRNGDLELVEEETVDLDDLASKGFTVRRA